ncbi:MAG TPA: ribonuclease J [Thermomicrobiales bacterium]|nr:ribonuclease J [Thermomicrobiales bacterium]
MSGSDEVRLIFLGGMAEVGKNLCVVESDDDLIVIDFGLGFPEESEHGVDVVLPDVSYLKERREKVRGIFITHGHEDHIGALPYLWSEVGAPIHATRLTAGLITGKLREVNLDRQVEIHVFNPDEHPVLYAGDLSVEPFRVTHSIPDAVGFGITTPAGLIVHTSDFKFDPTPVDGKPTDYAKIEELGRRGVRLLVSDCVHVESEGSTPSESVISETYDQIFGSAPGRVIVATFASLIARIQQVIDVAGRYGRRVAPLGRSLTNNVRIAQELGYLRDPDNVLIDGRDAHRLPEDQVIYVVTGSQGEPMAVLSRIANREHHEIEIHDQDTVVISATPIPGNETSVYRIIDQLFHQGAEVIYSARARVHVSGHASRDELRRMIEMVQPEHVLPTHGEFRHLALYADLARETGIPDERIHMVAPGDVVSITTDDVKVSDHVETGRIFVEGRRMNTVNEEHLAHRDQIANEGIVTIAVAIDRDEQLLVGDPNISAVGVVMQLDDDLRDEMIAAIRESLETMLSRDVVEHSRLERRIQGIGASYIYRGHRGRPKIHPVILDVSSSQ